MIVKPSARRRLPAQPEGDAAQLDLEPRPVADVTTVLQALGDPIRLAIVSTLAASGGERPCGGFDLPVTKATLSHHFRVLREAGIILQRCEGTRRMTTLQRAELETAYPGLLGSILRTPPAPAAATR